MAELPGNGKQPPERHKPSRLRHEIRLDSPDDERESKEHVVQEPNSDTVVPETQLDYNGHYNDFNRGFDAHSDYGDDIPLSPNSLAVLKRTAVTKKPEALEPTPFTIKLLSKAGLNDNSASSVTPAFSFGQAKKASSKTPPKEGVAASQSTAHASLKLPLMQQLDEHVPNNSSAITAPELHPEPVISEYAQQDVPDTTSTQDSDESHPSSLVSKRSHRQAEADIDGFMQLEAASGLPTSVQPAARPIIGTRKTRIVKKTKKSKKGLLSQPRGGPWPPRPSNIAISSAIEDGVPETFADPRYLSQPEPQDDRVPDFLGDDMWSSATAPDYLKDVQSYTIYALQDVNIVNAQYDTQASNVICDMPETMSQQMCDTSAQRLYPTSPKHESHTPFGGPFSVEPEEHSLKFAHDQAAVPQYEDMPHEQHLMPSPQEPQHHQSPPHVNGPTDNEPELTAPPSYPEVEVSTGRPAPQPKAFEAALHGASYRGGPHRVSKPRHKVRAISGPLPHGLQGPSMSLGVERSLENLRVAMLADSFRTQHEHTTTTKHHEEITAMLNQTIGLQNDTIAEYKQKHQDLDSALSRLTDKAKTNQRYVTGLQKDYEKLQKFVTTFQDQNKKTLQAKIAEIENEKDVLRREFETTTDKLARSQREMKTTLDDIYIRYVISESKKKDLAKNLSRQEAMCQEDRRKRDDLEKQLLSGVQSVQRQLGDSSTALIEKLELLQSSVNNLADDDDHTLEIKECLAVTRSLQLTPFLSTKDVQKAEGMLRFVHERLESGLGAISETVKCKPAPDTELQDFIKQQLQILQTEMVKYEDVVAENRKAHEANNTLKKQLETQQQHCSQLDEQIKAFQQSEKDLRARSSQLERELNDLKDVSQDPETEPSELERGMIDLRQQLRKAEDDLQAVNIRIEKAEQVRQELEQDGAKYKKWWEAITARLKAEEAEKQKIENSDALREKIAKDYESKFSEKESNLKSEVRHLTLQREEKEYACQELRTELDAANDKLDQLNKQNKTLESDLNAVRKEQLATEAKLIAAQQTDPLRLAETATLKEQLRQTTEELRSKTQDYTELERRCTEMSNKATHLQGMQDQLQAQVSQHASAMENARQEADRRVSEMRQDTQKTLQLTQDQASTLEQEKQSLLSKLEQSRLNEAELNKTQATFLAEREKLLQQLAGMRAIKEAKEVETPRVEADYTERNRKPTVRHGTEIEDWSRRLTQTDAALKEAEAKLRLSEDQFQAKLASDRKRAEDNLLQVEQKYKTALQAATKLSSIDQQHASQSSVDQDRPLTRPLETHAGKTRKKLNRQNNSVFNNAGASTTQSSTPTGNPSSIFQAQRERTELSPTLFDEHTGGDDLFDDENCLFLIGRESDYVPKIQEVGGLSLPQNVFDERLAQASQQERKRQKSSSTDFSSISSEELRQMQKEAQPVSTSMLRGLEYSSSKHDSSQVGAKETPMRSDNVSVAGSRSSQSNERPRSQANTASRMMPPPNNESHHFRSRNQAQDGGTVSSRHALFNKSGQKFSSNGTSTPDFMHPPSSVRKQTYSGHDPRNFIRTGSRQRTPRVMEQGHTEKRKSSTDQSERETAVKKQRTSSQAYPVVSSSASRNYSPFNSRSSVVGSRSTTQADPAYVQGATSTSSRSKTQASSSSIQPRTSSQIPSSSDGYSSRRQQPSSSQFQAASPMRRISTRLTRSKINNATAFDDRFDRELSGR